VPVQNDKAPLFLMRMYGMCDLNVSSGCFCSLYVELLHCLPQKQGAKQWKTIAVCKYWKFSQADNSW